MTGRAEGAAPAPEARPSSALSEAIERAKAALADGRALEEKWGPGFALFSVEVRPADLRALVEAAEPRGGHGGAVTAETIKHWLTHARKRHGEAVAICLEDWLAEPNFLQCFDLADHITRAEAP